MLLYKHGALNQRTCEQCEFAMNKYEYPVLLNAILDYNWTQINLKLFPQFSDDYGDEPVHIGRTHMYCQISVPQGHLYFMYCKEDYEKVCSLPTVIDKQPFQTLLGR